MLAVVGKVRITDRFEPHPAVAIHVDRWVAGLASELDKVCGYTEVDLEGRFDHLRSQETNVANFVADIIRTEYTNVDLVMLNTGTLRSNARVPPGPLRRRFVADMLPMKDKIFLLKMPGHIVKDMLENAVSLYPKLDGRFPALSGCRLTFDAAEPPGSRISPEHLRDGEDVPLDPQKEYVVAVKEYIA